jgi:hypothetical protein
MLPTQQLLEKVSKEIKRVPNRQGEHLRKVHYGCYLLCHKSGLRVSEAVRFDLENRTRQGLYRIEKPKGKKERLVYIPKEVIKELRKNNWQPNSTNRFNFYHFLKKIKRELGISANVELTPHTLRHAFTTYQAESGLPLPILQKLLGHSSIRTTALYWQNIYQGPDNDDINSILAGKNWLERPKPSQSKEPPKSPITENFPEIPKNSKPIFIDQKPVILHKKPIRQNNSLSILKLVKKTPGMLISEISPRTPEKFSLNPTNKKINQLKTSQPLAITTNKEQKPTKKKAILLAKIKLLEKQLKQAQELAEKEKQRADNYQHQLKTIAKTLYQLPKASYYQQLDQEQKAQIEQSPKPPDNLRSGN